MKRALLLELLLLLCCSSCVQSGGPSPQQVTQRGDQQPVIEASPVQAAGKDWQAATSENVTLTVTAPGAEMVKILYRPVVVEGRHIELASLRAPSDKEQGKFTAQIKIAPDFAGDVWAETFYKNGQKKQTASIALTAESSAAQLSQSPTTHTDESARSDKLTGGRIEKAAFQPGQANLTITVNAPAFELTLWQNGKEVKTYQIGIGRKAFPLPSGERKATQIIFNPEWVPPDSSWVEDDDVSPGERIEADDPRNPLGKIKIPLGDGILIHQAARPSDLGHLVSHGCVRLTVDDLFDLAEKICEARSVPISKQEIDSLRNSKERRAVKLDPPMPVDINYDTQVIEGGVLHLYPDVYNRNTATIENLRSELQDAGVEASAVDDQTLTEMLKRVTPTEQFVVSLTDIKAARALTAGSLQPLTQEPVKRGASPRPSKGAARR